ncbi:MAG TPA: polysaccharide biosynthesis C-terminal domain-containing protein [Planctomycetota bacterium]|nr:polysaccharide biosynthesis C-terminal domain-containing protein [Planctomycetota bacterium]
METTDGKIEGASAPSVVTRIWASAAARDAMLVLGAQAIGTIIALVTDALLFRRLSVPERGFFSAALALQAVLLILSDLGVSLTTVRVGAEYYAKGLVQEAHVVFRRALVTRMILGFGVAGAAFLFSSALVHYPMHAGKRVELVWAAASGIVGISMIAWSVDVAQARRRFGLYFATQVAAAVMRGWILITMITRLTPDPESASSATADMLTWGVAAAACLAGILSIIMQREVLESPKLSDTAYDSVNAELSRFAGYAAATVVLAGLGGYVELLLIQQWLGAEKTAVFDGARKLAMLLPLISTATTTVLLPRAAALSSVQACEEYAAKAFRVSLPLAFATAGGLAVLSGLLVPLFWGDKYEASIPLLRWLCLGFFFNVLFNPLSLVLYPLRRENLLLALNALSIALSLGLGFLLIPSFGPSGAAWSVAAVKVVIMLLCGAAVWWSLNHPGANAFSTNTERTSS